MWTSNGSALAPAIATPSRVPLRLRMAEHPGRSPLHGGWWPQSRDLAVELADLVDHFPPRFGRLVGASIFPPEWNPAPWRIPVAGGYVTVGPFPRDDRHLIHLKTSDRTMLHVLVVPPGVSHAQADEALLASAADGNLRSGTEILQDVAERTEGGR